MTDMHNITEIIPEDIFKDPDLEWARIAFEEGNFFNVVVERIRKLERFRKAAEAMFADEIYAHVEYDAALVALTEDIND